MLRILSAFLLAGTSVALVAQSLPSNLEKADSKLANCTVSGRVVTAGEGSPIKSARVTLMLQNPGENWHFYQSTSDSEGRFVVQGVAPGRYQFFATHAGYVNRFYHSEEMDEGTVLALKPGQKITDVLFRMVPAAVATGRITDEDGEPMAEVEVTALQPPSDEEDEDDSPFHSRVQDLMPVESTRTDDRGQYRIFGLRPGEYYLRASETEEPHFQGALRMDVHAMDVHARQELGTGYASLYYPGVLQLDQAQLVSVRAGEEVQADFAFRPVKTVTVSGRVIGPKGPASGASINLEQLEAGDSSNHYTSSDEKGSFTLKGIAPGRYAIIASYRGDGDKPYQGQQRVEVGNEDVSSIALLLGGGVTVHGHISVNGRGAPALDRLQVILFSIDEEGPTVARGNAKKDGTLEIASVKDGSYAVEVYGLGHDWYVKSVRIGRDDVFERGLQVERGNPGGALEIGLDSDSAQLEGSVSDKEHVVAGARVRIRRDPETPYNRRLSQTVRTDQAGHFVITGMPPGKYRVVARLASFTRDVPLKSGPQSVTLAGRDHKTIELKIVHPEDESQP
jgi:protocatechuate 3,4-dioxygenase beta subunit